MGAVVVTFFYDWLFVLAVLCGFGICGLGFLINASSTERPQIFAAPLIGLMVVPFGANTLYSILGVEYSYATLISAASCVFLTLMQWRWPLSILVPKATSVYYGVFAASIGALSVLINDASALHAHGPAIFYYDGSDHAGYAHMADWLSRHLIRPLPSALPDRPYENLPALLFLIDPRFGSFGLLEIISQLHRTSAIFSYDLACAVIFSAGSLGVAAIFGQTPTIFAILTLGLFTSHWYDYAHSGYFAKTISYPAALLVAGLTLKALPRVTVESVVALAFISAAMGTMHSGVGSAFLMIPILGTSIAAIAVWRDDSIQLSKAILLCGLVSSSPIIAAGLSARPLAVAGYPDYSLSWMYIWPRLLDLENQGVAISSIPPFWLLTNFFLALIIWALLLGVAVFIRSYVAVGLLGGPAVLLLVLSISRGNALAFQLIGYFYPAALCGTCIILANAPRRTLLVFGLVLSMIGQRIPRLIGAIDRYALHQDKRYLFTATEIDRLADQIGRQRVEIDVPDVLPGLLLMVELGRRNLDLQWSDRAWSVLSHGWAAPKSSGKAELVLRQTDPVIIDHFQLEHSR
jgi:hypothetical protein